MVCVWPLQAVPAFLPVCSLLSQTASVGVRSTTAGGDPASCKGGWGKLLAALSASFSPVGEGALGQGEIHSLLPDGLPGLPKSLSEGREAPGTMRVPEGQTRSSSLPCGLQTSTETTRGTRHLGLAFLSSGCAAKGALRFRET